MPSTDTKALLFLKKNPIGVACGIITVALLAFGYMRWDAVSEAEDLLQQKSTQADRIAQNIVNSAQLKEQYADMKAQMDKINGRLISETTLAANLQYFYHLESEVGVKVVELTQGKDVKPVKAKPSSFYTIPFALSVEGEYAKAFAYLRALETGHHYCRLNSVVMNSSVTDPSLVVISFRLDLLGQL